MIDNRLEKYFEDACMMLDNLGIVYGPIRHVEVNNRAKSRWGRCKYSKRYGVYDIEISSMLLQEDVSYEAVMDTMIHELLHCHSDRFCHTGEWKTCANLVNAQYGYNIKRATAAEEKNIAVEKAQFKYIITCNKCGTVSKYRRAGKVVKLLQKYPENHCVCSICKGTSFTVKSL